MWYLLRSSKYFLTVNKGFDAYLERLGITVSFINMIRGNLFFAFCHPGILENNLFSGPALFIFQIQSLLFSFYQDGFLTQWSLMVLTERLKHSCEEDPAEQRGRFLFSLKEFVKCFAESYQESMSVDVFDVVVNHLANNGKLSDIELQQDINALLRAYVCLQAGCVGWGLQPNPASFGGTLFAKQPPQIMLEIAHELSARKNTI